MRTAIVLLMLLFSTIGRAQFLMDMVDTTTETGKGLLNIYKKFDHLRFSGYIQPQFQWASAKGASSYEGGDFGSRVNNRFMLRRSRIRLDYVHYNASHKPGVQFVFQFDVNERSFTIRDVWGRIFENRFKCFSFTTGMFARPFGYEVNLSSADRESPERGRMSQILMKSERDLGAMISFDVRKDKHPLKKIKIDFGVFNGQGLNAPGEFDNAKDFIGRIALKPVKLSKNISLSAGTSILYGGLESNTRYVFRTETVQGIKTMVVDSAQSNLGYVAPRHYVGADLQLKFKNHKGFTELRAEWISGRQSATQNSSETPNALLTGTDGFHIRRFNGAYFYFLQHLFSPYHQLILKYDWYDPNASVSGNEIGAAGSNLGAANVKFSTLGIGYGYTISENVKLTIYYDRVRNEQTQLAGFVTDRSDDVLTTRLQFRF